MNLTIVLPTAGRAEFTKRFVDHASKLPFLIELDEDDAPLPVERYFAKVRDAVARVTTPYTILCDNDDLPTKELEYCCSFLRHHPDYVACSGRIQGFHMWPDPLMGPYSAVTAQYSPYDTPANYGQDSANERILAGFANSWSYYAVYRTEALQRIRREVCSLGLTNLQVHEKFCAMRALTMGKVHCDQDYTSLYRQYATGSAEALAPWPNEDMMKVVAMMGGAGVERIALTQRWLAWYAKRDRYFRGSVRKTAKALFPSLAWYVQNRHRYLPHKELAL